MMWQIPRKEERQPWVGDRHTMWRDLGHSVYLVGIGKGIGVRGLWRKEKEERKGEGRGNS